MHTMLKIDLSIYSVLIPLIIIIYIKQSSDFKDGSTNYFLQSLCFSLIVSLVQGLTWIPNGINSSSARIMNHILVIIFYTLSTLPTFFWVRYFDFKIFNDIQGLKIRSRFYFIPTIIGWILLITNFYTEIIFTISEMNLYNRGQFNSSYIIINHVFLLIVLLSWKPYWKRIKGNLLNILMIFVLFPVFGSLIQQLFYGVSFTYPLLNITALLTFLYLEKELIYMDTLTGLFTRHQFEKRLKYKLESKDFFSVIMIDLNDFKLINDNFGHDEGDKALKTVSSILKSNVKHEDMVCRYGGDEFILLIESTHQNSVIEVVERIKKSLDDYNSKKINKYSIKMSYGYNFVDSDMTMQNLLTDVDKKMYQDKRLKKTKI